MSIKDYISSGILEAYALGDLTDVERLEVEKMVRQHPEVAEELRRIEEVQEAFLMRTATQPSSMLRAKILDQIPNNEAKVVALNIWKFAAAACLALTAIATYFAMDYRSRWKQAESDLIAVTDQQRQLAERYNQVNDRINRMENDLDVMENPQFSRIVMKSVTPTSPESMASVYWNTSSNELYLKIQNLKNLASDQQYQLWAIIDGKPVDAGVFDASTAGMIRMKDIGKGATTFAVTVEPRGGKPTPTMETMQVAGNVAKS